MNNHRINYYRLII